jgi:ubiquinone/menaquinone biosynthesis C-methylase UbiE
MDASLQRRVQRYGWDKAAVYYEDFWHNQLKPAQDLLMEITKLKAGERVLDTASGTGLVSFRARQEVGDNGYVLGTDISDKMVEIATGIAREKNIPGIQFARMDAEDLNAADNSFDVAICALGLMYLPDPLKGLREMHRVLRSGGRAAAAGCRGA